jgi:hypothetical protein
MYAYNLIVKKGDDLDEQGARAMLNRELTERFGPAVHYITHAVLSNEIVAIVRHDSKRNLQSTLGDWFAEGRVVEAVTGYPNGTLLHYREITPDEPIAKNLLGG